MQEAQGRGVVRRGSDVTRANDACFGVVQEGGDRAPGPGVWRIRKTPPWSAGELLEWLQRLQWTSTSIVSHPAHNRRNAGW
eukprot:5032560-Alexandrium_andersonii.AAC.1